MPQARKNPLRAGVPLDPRVAAERRAKALAAKPRVPTETASGISESDSPNEASTRRGKREVLEIEWLSSDTEPPRKKQMKDYRAYCPTPRGESKTVLLPATAVCQTPKSQEARGDSSQLTPSHPQLGSASSPLNPGATRGGLEQLDDLASVLIDKNDALVRQDLKKRFECEFASSVLRGLSLSQIISIRATIKQLRPWISEQIRTFHILAAHRASCSDEIRASSLIYHSRQGILENLMRLLRFDAGVAQSVKKNKAGLSVVEKLNMWDFDPTVPLEPGRRAADIENLDRTEEDPSPEEFANSKSFLLQGPEHRWLLDQIKIALSVRVTNSTYSDVRRQIVDMLGYASDPSRLSLTLKWQPVLFLQEQYPDSPRPNLSSIITLAGTSTDAQALSCEDYVHRMWPRFGQEVLARLQDAMHRLDPQKKDQQEPEACRSLEVSFEEEIVEVIATGNAPYRLEVAEIFVWLTTACRTSDWSDRATYCRPRLTKSDDTIHIDYDYIELETSTPHNDATCWQSMFRNPVIAHGYPIAKRESTKMGLEVSVDMMTMLAQTPRSSVYQGHLLMKGFNSILAPVKRLGNSVLWHFLVHKDKTERMSYNDGLAYSTIRAHRDAMFPGARHFVGWATHVDLLTGTDRAPYDGIDWSDGELIGATISAEPVLGVSIGKIASLSGKIIRGSKDTPEYLSSSGCYEQRMSSATRWPVVLSDSDTRTHWLADGSSSILHLCRTWLSPQQTAFRCESSATQILQSGSACGPGAAYHTLVDRQNRELPLLEGKREVKSTIKLDNTASHGQKERGSREKEIVTSWFTFENLVDQFFDCLEQMRDRAIKTRTSLDIDLDLKRFLKTNIMGFDFKDAMRNDGPIEPRSLEIGSSAKDWLKFANAIDAVHLFGEGFGQLVEQPVEFALDKLSCGQKGPPAQGADLLVVPLAVLKKVTERCRNHTEAYLQISQELYIPDPTYCFTSCDCHAETTTARCTTVVRKLYSAKKQRAPGEARLRDHPLFARHPAGAYLFGHVSNKLLKVPPIGLSVPRKRKEASEEKGGQASRPLSDSGYDSAGQPLNEHGPENCTAGGSAQQGSASSSYHFKGAANAQNKLKKARR